MPATIGMVRGRLVVVKRSAADAVWAGRDGMVTTAPALARAGELGALAVSTVGARPAG